MKKIILVAAMALVSFVVAAPAAAVACGCGAGHDKGPGKMMGGPHHGMDMDDDGPQFWKCPVAKEKLGLSDEVVKKLEALHADAGKKAEAIHTEIRDLKKELHSLFEATPVDTGKVKALATKIGAKKQAMFDIHVATKAEALNLLTADQKAKLFEMKGKGPGMEGRHGKCGCGEGKCGCDGDKGCGCGKMKAMGHGDAKCGCEDGDCGCAEGKCGCAEGKCGGPEAFGDK